MYVTSKERWGECTSAINGDSDKWFNNYTAGAFRLINFFQNLFVSCYIVAMTKRKRTIHKEYLKCERDRSLAEKRQL